MCLSASKGENYLSTTAEQIAALRAGTILAKSVPEQSEQATDVQEANEQEDELLIRIFELGLFDAIVPSPDGERIYEYEERRKQFNLIMHDFISEQLDAQSKLHEEEKEDINERLTNTQNLLDREIIRAADLQFDLDKLQTEYGELKETYEKSKEQKKYEAPSEPLQNRIANLKQLSADEMVARFNERQAANNKNVTAEIPVLQFRTENSETELGNHSIFASAEIPKVDFPTFLETAHRPEAVQTDGTDGEVVPQAIKDYIEQRLIEFKKDLEMY